MTRLGVGQNVTRAFSAAVAGQTVPFDHWIGPWRWKRHTTPPDLPGISFVRDFVDAEGKRAWRMVTKVTVE